MNEDCKPKEEPLDGFDDALRTLASAAIERDSMPLPKKEVIKNDANSDPASPATEMMEPPWFDVGIIKGTSCVVNEFFLSDSIDHSGLTLDNLPDYIGLSKVELHPGTAYKFRVAAINSCGRGEWSDVSAFKTCLPGFPGAPCSIRISRSAEGARLQWEPPTMCSGKIVEYSVCLAVKVGNPGSTVSLKDLPFVRVYCGAENTVFVDSTSLKSAYVDKSIKPAIIFRIAARNEKGYGPATQVRWLQDFPSSPSKNEHRKEAKKSKLPRLHN